MFVNTIPTKVMFSLITSRLNKYSKELSFKTLGFAQQSFSLAQQFYKNKKKS